MAYWVKLSLCGIPLLALAAVEIFAESVHTPAMQFTKGILMAAAPIALIGLFILLKGNEKTEAR